MDNQELIVPFNKEQMEEGLRVMRKIMPFMIGAGCCLLYLSFWLRRFLGHYITFFMQSIIILILIMFIIGFISGIFMNKTEPAARLTQEGIWVKHFGFILWSEIDIFDYYKFPGAPLIGIGIRVKNNKKLAKQASFNGLMGIFWSKIIGYPPIIIFNTSIDSEEIMAFARRFKPE
jgi:hypothetical protein